MIMVQRVSKCPLSQIYYPSLPQLPVFKLQTVASTGHAEPEAGSDRSTGSIIIIP